MSTKQIPLGVALLLALLNNKAAAGPKVFGMDFGRSGDLCTCDFCTSQRAGEAALKAQDAAQLAAGAMAARHVTAAIGKPNRTPCPEFCAWTQSPAYSAMLTETFGDTDSRLERAFIAGMQHEADRAGEAAVDHATSLRFAGR